VFHKSDRIIKLIVITSDTPTQSKSIKEEMINITIKNPNSEIKITRLSKDRKEAVQVSLMNEAKCHMKATKSLKL